MKTIKTKPDVFVSLTKEEMEVLYNHHYGEGEYWSLCESTNRRLSEKADPEDKLLFLSGPCAELPMTPENWLKRAEIFKSWKLDRWRRAKVFK